MYLKSIDIIGFKSFPDKTKITLDSGMSCIVGPNGSGKSNISDALRWVLGEQSARNLRGGRLEDIIFSGSKSRKPLGMAEVIITLDNSDGHFSLPFTEVTVSRRAFRSGQSEYLINNQSCRLKDIHSLFADSGIGLEGVSIISQGQISELITAKPEERRSIVEEAAGIIKYRNRKREAMKKLNDTELNLERLADIIGELSDRLGPLSEEDRTARAYLELSKEADALEINLSSIFLKDIHGKLSGINEILADAEDKIMMHNTARLSLEAESESLRLAITGIDEEVDAMQKEFYRLQTVREHVSAQKQIYVAKKQLTEETLTKLVLRIEELTADAAARLNESTEMRQKASELKAEIEKSEDGLSSEESRRKEHLQAIAVFDDKLESLKAEAFDVAGRLTDFRNKLHYEEQLKASSMQSANRLEQQKLSLEDSASDNIRQKSELGSHLEQGRKQKEILQKQLDTKKSEQVHLMETLSETSADETETRFKLNSLESRVAMMEEMADSYEGYYPGVRSVLLAKKQGNKQVEGVVDVFAALINVPEQYRVAVETFLGSALQDIVCETEAAAKSAIAYLKNANGGRATFLPLDTINVRKAPAPEEIKKLHGIHGAAAALLEYPETVRRAAEFLLGHVLVADDLESASQAARSLGYKYNIVTLDGDILHPGGSLSGGSRNKKNGEILSRKAELENGRLQLQELRDELSKRTAALAAVRSNADTLSQSIDDDAEYLRQLNNDIYAWQRDAEALEAADSALQKQIQSLTQEITGLNGEISDNDIRMEEIALQSEEWLFKDTSLNGEIEEIRVLLTEKQTLFAAEQEDFTIYRVELARSQEALAGYLREEKRLTEEYEAILWDQESGHADREQAESELTSLNNDLLAEAEKELETEHLLNEQQGLLDKKRNGLAAELDKLQGKEKEARAYASQTEKMRAELYQQQVKKARLEADWENEEEKLKEKFNMDFAAISQLPLAELSKKELRERLMELKEAINVLGNINLNAIEQFKEVSERYEFLTAQDKDLRDAEQSLLKVIAEMDSVMKIRFKDSFERLSDEFDISFKRLFRGGSAALVMTEPEDVLETGIDLSVDLPGKKISNHNLLSGGEKALVGLALMFAVLAVRPTPFCVMDEVDAALDESNVDRFAEYLREMARGTQFLMISHRQGTMEAADSLWGVTMEEEGVTKMVSVRLQEAIKAG